MLGQQLTNFLKILLISSLITVGCTPLSTSNPSTPATSTEKKAFAVARIACNSLHSMEIEPPKNISAVLISVDEANRMLGYNIIHPSLVGSSKVWLVELNGRWQLLGGPAPVIETPATPNLPAPAPELWNVCKVVIDSNNWQDIYVSEGWQNTIH